MLSPVASIAAMPSAATDGVVMNFNNTYLLKEQGSTMMDFSYDGYFTGSSLSFSNTINIDKKNRVALSIGNAGVTLTNSRLNEDSGNLPFITSDGSLAKLIGVTAPTKPVCNLSRSYEPGIYNITFSLDPAYQISDKSKLLGYWIDCTVIKS